MAATQTSWHTAWVWIGNQWLPVCRCPDWWMCTVAVILLGWPRGRRWKVLRAGEQP